MLESSTRYGPTAKRPNEVWEKLECPHCHEANWFSFSTSDDITSPGDEAGECCSCNKTFWLDETIPETREVIGDSVNLEDAYVAKGKESPE